MLSAGLLPLPLLAALLAASRADADACGDSCLADAASVSLLQRQEGLQLLPGLVQRPSCGSEVSLLQRQGGLQLLQEGADEPPPAEGGSLVESSADLRKRAAMCSIKRSFAVGPSAQDPASVRAVEEAMLARMAAHPTDFHLQKQSCLRFSVALTATSGEEATPVLAGMDRAVGAALAATPPSLDTAKLCISVMMGPAVFNRPYTLMLNRTTHTLEHIIQMLRMFPDDRALQEDWLNAIAYAASYVAPELSPVVHRLGGFDVLFAALERYRDDPNVTMAAWRGLSDHSHNPYGAAVIANHGGPLKGIDFIVNELRRHPQPYLAESPTDHLTLKYEIMQISSGLLQWDSNNTYGKAFVAAGFIPQLLGAMRAEPDLRGTQTVACDCMNSLLQHDPKVADALAENGAVPLAWAAVVRFRGLADNTPWCGTTLGAVYPVVPNCRSALGRLASASAKARLQLEALAGGGGTKP